jgi:hypothetical protein
MQNNFWKFALWLAMCTGIALRLWFYLLDDSLWRDETNLLLNVAQNSFFDLLKPLHYNQESPITFLWFLRVLWLSGANGELSMRAVSLCASLLSLFFFYRIIMHFLSDQKARFFSLALFALSPGIILYAASVKQYSIDILAAAILLYASRSWFIPGNSTSSAIGIKSFLLAVAAPWFSLPSIFIIIAQGAGLIIKNRNEHLRQRPALLFIALGCASFAVEWLAVLHRSLMRIDLDYYLRYHSLGGWLWNFKQLFFAYTGPNIHMLLIAGISLASILLLVGIFEARRRHGPAIVVFLLLPLVLAFGGGLIKVYPLFGRCLLFATPGIYLFIGYGMSRLFRSGSRSIITGCAILVLLIFPCLAETLRSYTKRTGGVREALQFIADRQHNDDVVLCDTYSAPSIAYYRLIGRPWATILKFALEPEKQIEGNAVSEGLPAAICSTTYARQRVWLIAETIFYARGNGDTKLFQRSLVTTLHLQRFIEKQQAYFLSKKDNMLDYWRNTLQNVSAKRQVFDQYSTNRVQVCGFDKQSITADPE